MILDLLLLSFYWEGLFRLDFAFRSMKWYCITSYYRMYHSFTEHMLQAAGLGCSRWEWLLLELRNPSGVCGLVVLYWMLRGLRRFWRVGWLLIPPDYAIRQTPSLAVVGVVVWHSTKEWIPSNLSEIAEPYLNHQSARGVSSQNKVVRILYIPLVYRNKYTVDISITCSVV